MILTIEKIVYPGRRLARNEGRVYFTDEGLPGESVEAEILKVRSSYVEARTTAILAPSPRRIPVRCGHFLACGSYQPLPYPDQLDLKKAQAAEIFRKIAPESLGALEIVPSPREWRYRNKIRFFLAGAGREIRLAYHKPGSREDGVAVDGECFLASERAGKVAAAILSAAREIGSSNLSEIEIRESEFEHGLLVNLFWRMKPGAAELEAIAAPVRAEFSPTGIVSWAPRPNGLPVPFQEDGRDAILERMGETVYEIGAGSFFQVNPFILPEVLRSISAAAGLSGRETLADIYGGVGTFGLGLAPQADRVFVVESSGDNVRRLKANITRNRLDNVEVFPGLSERWMGELSGRGLDVVVLDPPRKGLDPRVIRALLEHPAGKIVYLSCNPTTLARDLELLKAGYAPRSLRLFDFFPQTPHIETLAVLSAL